MTRDWWKPWRSNLKVFRLNQHTLGPLNTFWTLECAPVCLCHLFCSANPAIKPTTLKAALSDILMAPTYRTSNDTKISIIFFYLYFINLEREEYLGVEFMLSKLSLIPTAQLPCVHCFILITV